MPTYPQNCQNNAHLQVLRDSLSTQAEDSSSRIPAARWQAGTEAPLWPKLWSGARFWLDSLKWQVEEETMNSFACIPCLLAAIQWFMSGVLYAGGYKENCSVFSLCLKNALFEYLFLSPSIQNTCFPDWKGTSSHWYKRKISSSHHYFINSVCNS